MWNVLASNKLLQQKQQDKVLPFSLRTTEPILTS